MQGNPNPRLIYDFIGAYWKENGYAPSSEEIANHIGRSYQVTYGYLVRLRACGSINWKPHTIRTVHISGEYLDD